MTITIIASILLAINTIIIIIIPTTMDKNINSITSTLVPFKEFPNFALPASRSLSGQ
jgi:hypothetical protein